MPYVNGGGGSTNDSSSYSEDPLDESLNGAGGSRPILDEDHLTLVTHATPEFLYPDVLSLLEHWPSPQPLSVAVYAPGEDFCLASALISWLWTCNQQVKDQVSFHVFFPSDFANDIALKTASDGIRILEGVNCSNKPVVNYKSYRAVQVISLY